VLGMEPRASCMLGKQFYLQTILSVFLSVWGGGVVWSCDCRGLASLLSVGVCLPHCILIEGPNGGGIWIHSK
jgi:hypothetical protein